ncbi:hypothetical protein Tco_1449267 [Tanacetum coccineum]
MGLCWRVYEGDVMNLWCKVEDSLNSAANGNFLTKKTKEALTIIENKSKVKTSRNKPQVSSASGSSTQDSAIAALTKQEDLKFITTRSGVTLAGPLVPPPPLSSSKEVERDPESTTDQVLIESTTRVPPPVVQPSPVSNSFELPPSPASSSVTPKRNPHQPLIPYPSRLINDKLQDKVDIQIHSFLQMFKKLYFNISFAEALAHMPNPTPSSDLVVASLSPSLTPFRDSDFVLEEIDTFLASNDSTSPNVDDGIFDSEGDIRLIEELLNNEILNDLPPPLPVFEINESKKIKTSIDDPPDLELKDLPPHLEYAFLEETSKLPVIISKDLK